MNLNLNLCMPNTNNDSNPDGASLMNANPAEVIMATSDTNDGSSIDQLRYQQAML